MPPRGCGNCTYRRTLAAIIERHGAFKLENAYRRKGNRGKKVGGNEEKGVNKIINQRMM
jgi:hypothetical protein